MSSAPFATHFPILPPLIPFFVIAGPTAVGKSDVAVAVAERCEGEIVSADAFQIYHGLDLLTAKPPPELRARVPHHLVGEIPLTEAFNVAQYLDAARQRIAAIHGRGQLAIVAGGTGLYVRALTHGLADLPTADPTLRAELASVPLAELQSRLDALDPDTNIDRQNPRRVIRALEVCLLTGQPFSSFREQWNQPAPHVRGVVLTRERTELCARIDRRTEAMFAAGVEVEVRGCGELGPTANQTLGLCEIRALLDGRMTREQCIAAIQQATRQYAKRQMTWFRRERALAPIDLTAAPNADAVVEQIAALASAAR